MTEREFLHAVMKKNMPDKEQVRKMCLQTQMGAVIWRRKLAAAIVCVLAVLSVGSGVCYATTGESPVKLFSALFKNADADAVALLGEEFVETDETIEFDNLQFVLEKYFFDWENGVALAQMTLKSVDGSPVISWEEAYLEAVCSGEIVGSEVSSPEEWEKICQNDEEQYECYKNVCELLFTGKWNVYWPMDNAAINNVLEIESPDVYYIYEICIEREAETEEISNEDQASTIIPADPLLRDIQGESALGLSFGGVYVGKIPVKDTGTLTLRQIDKTKIVNCTEVILTGAYMQLHFAYENDGYFSDFEVPFEEILITTQDGKTYCWEKTDWSRFTAQNAEGEMFLSEVEEQDIENDENMIKVENWSTISHASGNAVMTIDFPEFLQTDNIISVTVDGVECLSD